MTSLSRPVPASCIVTRDRLHLSISTMFLSQNVVTLDVASPSVCSLFSFAGVGFLSRSRIKQIFFVELHYNVLQCNIFLTFDCSPSAVMAPVVSVYPALEEATEHERLMRFQSRVPGRRCVYQ